MRTTLGRTAPLPSFFARAYSTYFQRRPLAGLTARTRQKPLLYAQARAGKLGVRIASPDPRFTRAKSPRNRRYRMRYNKVIVPESLPLTIAHFTRRLPELGRHARPTPTYRRPHILPYRPLEIKKSGLITYRIRRKVIRARYRAVTRRLRRLRKVTFHPYRRLRARL